MAKVAVPIVKLAYPGAFTFPNEIYEIFEGEGVWNPNEDFTFTGRICLERDRSVRNDAEVDAKRDRIRKRLVEVVEDKEALNRLLALLDEHEWDVSFFVDCY